MTKPSEHLYPAGYKTAENGSGYTCTGIEPDTTDAKRKDEP
jgi:hypothetical protein